MSRSHVALGMLALAVACLGALLFHNVSLRDPSDVIASTNGSAEEIESPRLHGIRRLDDIDLRFSSYKEQPPDVRPSAETEVRIRGVVLRGTEPCTSGEAYVVAGGDDYHLLGRGNIGVDGHFAVTFSASSETEVHVGALVEGMRRVTESLRVAPGSEHQLKLISDGGLSAEGSVVDTEGLPVPGLSVFVTSNPYRTTASYTEKYFEFNELRYAKAGSEYFEASGVTDDSGVFTVGGLGPGKYILLSRDRAWFIRQDQDRFDPETTGLVFVAEPALNLRLTALDVLSGEPIDEFMCKVAAQVGGVGAYVMPVMGKHGDAVVTWRSLRKGREFTEGLSLDLTFLAARYEALSARVTYAPGERMASYEARMVPVTPGVAKLRVLDEDGRHVNIPLAATLVGYRDGKNEARNSEYPRIKLVKLEEPGLYRLDAGVGAWWASVKPDHDLGPLVSWRGMIEIPAGGGEGEALITLPSFANVRFVVTESRAGCLKSRSTRLFLRRHNPGISTGISVSPPDTVIEGFPPGRWSFRNREPGCEWEEDLDVPAGQETVVYVGGR